MSRPLNRKPWPRAIAAIFGLILALGVAHVPAMAQATKGRASTAPATAKTKAAPTSAATSLARVLPAGGAGFFVVFDGLDAHSAAWKASAMSKLLEGTTLGEVLEDLVGQGWDAYRGRQPTGRDMPTGAQLMAGMKRMLRQGFAVSGVEETPGKGRTVIAVRGASHPEVRLLIETMFAAAGVPKGERSTVVKEGRTVTIQGTTASWAEGDITLYTETAQVDRALQAVMGRARTLATHPGYMNLRRPEGGLTPVAVASLNLEGVPPPADVKAMGLDALQRIDWRFGFHQGAMQSVVTIEAPGVKDGVLSLLKQPTFDVNALPFLPAGLTSFTVLSLDPGATYDKAVAVLRKQRGGANQVARFEAAARQNLGVDLRRDVLAHLRAPLTIYDSSPAGEAALSNPFGGLTIILPAADMKAIGGVVSRLVEQANASFAASRRGEVEPPIQKLSGRRLGYRLNIPPQVLPPQMAGELAPTVVLGDKTLVLAGTDKAALAALTTAEASGRRRPFAPAVADVLKWVPSKLMFLNVSDPRSSLPLQITNLPEIIDQFNAGAPRDPGGAPPVQLKIDRSKIPPAAQIAQRLFPGTVAIAQEDVRTRIVVREAFPNAGSPAGAGMLTALLLPAVQASREAARRAQCMNNLKQMILAMHNHHDAVRRLPRAAITSPDGKPLLSWRVALLPYIEQQSLYKQFHLDEPWDSPHNKALIPLMPKTYECPSRPSGQPGLTYYRAFVGPGTLMELGRDTRIADILDGTSNTLAIVEAREGVPWTKPEDLPFDPKDAGIAVMPGSSHPVGFNAAFADGSVRFLKVPIASEILRAYITRNGGENVPFPGP